MTLDAYELAPLIDHTNLSPDATRDELDRLCADANAYGFGAVCVYAGDVSYVADRVDEDVAVCAVAGFPDGRAPAERKADEAAYAVEQGADEIDVVIHQGYLREGDVEAAIDDLAVVREAVPDTTLKVICETCNLSDEEQVWAYEAAHDAGADFIKTSTGFGSYGAREADVARMRDTIDRLGSDMGIKASGGITTAEQAEQLLAASGMAPDRNQFRIGASSGVDIVSALLES